MIKMEAVTLKEFADLGQGAEFIRPHMINAGGRNILHLRDDQPVYRKLTSFTYEVIGTRENFTILPSTPVVPLSAVEGHLAGS